MRRRRQDGWVPGRSTGTSADWPRWFEGLHRAVALSSVVDAGTRARLERARRFIETSAGEPIDLEAMARQACFSRFHFLRQFRQTYAVTPHQYLTQVRLERARALLRETDLSVTEVCFAVGYESLGSFSTLFARRFGHSPERYRARIYQVLGPPRPAALPVPACFLSALGLEARISNFREAPGPAVS